MYRQVLRRCAVAVREVSQSQACLTATSSRQLLACVKTCSENRAHYARGTNHQRDDYIEIQKELSILPNFTQEELDKYLEDPEKMRLYKILQMEIEVHRSESTRVPKNLTPKHWMYLLNLNTRSQRSKYLQFLWRIEIKRENMKKKHEEKIANIRRMKEMEEPKEGIKYGLGNNSLFIRISKSSMERYYNSTVIPALMFGPTVVFDCGWDHIMTTAESSNCAKQLVLSISVNRVHREPFKICLCNADNSGHLMQKLKRTIPTIYNDEFPVNITSQSYLEVFDKSRLVYLTPNCNTDLTEINSDMVYIIGAIVDKHGSQPVTMAKAKQEGIRIARLPLDRYLVWGTGGGKNLTLNQTLSILLDYHHTKSWKIALQHVPTRKLKRYQSRTKERKPNSVDDTLLKHFENK